MVNPVAIPKKLWFDTETTGLDHDLHGIVQLAMVVEVGNKVVGEKTFLMKPTGKTATPEALKVNGYTKEQIHGFSPWEQVMPEVRSFMDQFVDKFEKNDKFIACGQNVSFDVNFLKSFFESCGEKYLFSYIKAGAYIDTLYLVTILQDMGKIPILESRKLSCLADHFGIDSSKAHDALEDIHMTRAVYYKMRELLN